MTGQEHTAPMSEDEPTFTLRDAKHELALRECRMHGHSWDVLEEVSGPVAIICSNCGEGYNVTRRNVPR